MDSPANLRAQIDQRMSVLSPGLFCDLKDKLPSAELLARRHLGPTELAGLALELKLDVLLFSTHDYTAPPRPLYVVLAASGETCSPTLLAALRQLATQGATRVFLLEHDRHFGLGDDGTVCAFFPPSLLSLF